VDSKEVNKALRAAVRPFLKAAGFERWTDRNLGRRRHRTVEVVNFQSFNEYVASGVGCTTFSFAVRLGVYYESVRLLPWFRAPLPPRPREYECHARNTVASPPGNGERRDIWYVHEDGSNLPALMPELVRALEKTALPWFDELSSVERAIEIFETRDDKFIEGYAMEMLGGGRGSVASATVVSALALELGDRPRAVRAWEDVISNPFYARVPDVLKEARECLRALEDGGAAPDRA
jgi:hypothetical protein